MTGDVHDTYESYEDHLDNLPADEPETTQTVELVVRWETRHRMTVPVGTACPVRFDELMVLVEADPELGDITTVNAEPMDWSW